MTTQRLRDYLERIGWTGPVTADAPGLALLQAAHRQAIAFENLDIPLGRGIAIDSDSVFAKLVSGRRGGYCFEQNRLFADMLSQIGLPTRPLLARVRMGLAPGYEPPRSHVLLLGETGGESWLADAGFGGSYVPPLPLREGVEIASEDGARHRLRRIGETGQLAGEWLLERAGPAEATDGRPQPHGEWQPQYSFDLADVAPEDLEQANHWTATRPGTRFTTLQVVSITLPDGFASMVDGAMSLFAGGKAEKRSVTGMEDYAATLSGTFRLDLAAEDVARLDRLRVR